MDPLLLRNLQESLSLAVPDSVSEAELLDVLTHRINHLLVHDFQHLVQLLYRMDVPEQKLKQLLRQHPDTDAARIIATLVVERQQQKLETRKQFRQKNEEGTEEERW
ncbi:MAG TPA: hypothetical protein PKE63_11060 [Lacibacter sp.]|nr:hypothetical protein [Lacibacter sp.]HMO88447.1 hypothetical protein [Lacibacter sp.]HMP87809.1 hypothetical protein [Lacibacter sp.]